tara:strand:+ start:56 stop:607 length:552 start_codon:yes stop_codon:yes gene_type:complete
MGTPLEGNAFTKAMADNDGNYEAAKKQLEGSGIKMISTGMPGVNPMTNMIQPNQFAPSAMNPTALGSLQNQIPNLVGQSIPGSFDRVLPQGGALSPFSQSTHGMLGAKTSKEAAEAERRRKEAQKKAMEEANKKTKTSKPPRKLYKDIDGVVKDKDGKDAGYPTINESYTEYDELGNPTSKVN